MKLPPQIPPPPQIELDPSGLLKEVLVFSTPVIETELRGKALIAEPTLNKSTAFSDEERQQLGLVGLLPDSVESLAEQLRRVHIQFDQMYSDMERHVFLRSLQDTNEVLFHAFVAQNLRATLPIVYTPTVGKATQQFSRIYRRTQGLFLSYRNRDSIEEQINAVEEDISVIVATDAERILGLGDQGVGGIAIPNGKLSLYSAFGGISPQNTLGVMLDVGTNNESLLSSPEYLGYRSRRIEGHDYDEFMARFVAAVKNRWPNVLLQWEDFASKNSSRLLARHRDEILSFNDDIEGTAAVALATIWSAVRSLNRRLQDEVFCIVGAGSAGSGITRILCQALEAIGVPEAIKNVYLVDRVGLVHQERDDLLPFQRPLAHPDSSLDGLPLEEIIKKAGATVLVGATGSPGLFTESVVRPMLNNTDRPIVLPLSNPTHRVEATPQQVLQYTDGKAVIATGSPFNPIEFNGTRHIFSQANNVYIFPGLGLGCVAVKASRIIPEMFMEAAKAVFNAENSDVRDGVLPPLDEVPSVSRRIARAIGRVARDNGLCEPLTDEQIDQRISDTFWIPNYPTIVPA